MIALKTTAAQVKMMTDGCGRFGDVELRLIQSNFVSLLPTELSIDHTVFVGGVCKDAPFTC